MIAVLPHRLPLVDTLSLALPNEMQTQLLRAMLLQDEPGRAAFRTWHDSVPDARLALGRDTGLKQMLASLYAALRTNNVALDPALATYLRAAYTRERLRGETYRRICAEILALLARAAVPVCVIGGAALAQIAYDDPLLRHASTLDLWIAPTDLERATALLEAAGCVRETPPASRGTRRVLLRHASALPIVLHTALSDLPYYADRLGSLWDDGRPMTIAGIPALVLSPVDNLLLLCAPGSCMYLRRPPWWVCDAFRLILRHPDLEWSALLARARSTGLGLSLLVSLSYLQRDLVAPIPSQVLTRLAGITQRLTAPEYEAALWALYRTLPIRRQELLRRTRDWRSRGMVLKWLLVPSTVHLALPLRWQRTPLLPFYYLYRGIRWVRHRHIRSWAPVTHHVAL